MLINIDTANSDEAEYTALIALLASLGGRLPVATPAYQPNTGDRPETRVTDALVTEERPAPPPPAGNTAADALMQAEEARVAGAAPPPPGAVVLDADGIPWDARIHAGTKSQTKGKTWTKLRGVDEVLYGQVHAELQERHANDAPNDSTSTATTGEESAHGTGAEAAQDAPAPPPPSTTGNDAAGNALTGQETAGSAGTAGLFADFPAFVQAINAVRVPAIPYLELNTFAQTVGVAAFKDMKDHPELWETFYGLAGGQ